MKAPNITVLDLVSFKQLMRNEKPTIVKFFNPSCHLCRALTPIYNELYEEYKDNFDFAKLNTVNHPKIAKVFKIEGVPDLFVVKKDFVQQIPYPEDDFIDPECGYPKQYIIDHIERIKEILNKMEG